MRQNNEEICCVHGYQRLGNGTGVFYQERTNLQILS